MKKEKTREDFKTLKEYQDYVDAQAKPALRAQQSCACGERMAEQLIAKIELELQYYELEHDRQYI